MFITVNFLLPTHLFFIVHSFGDYFFYFNRGNFWTFCLKKYVLCDFRPNKSMEKSLLKFIYHLSRYCLFFPTQKIVFVVGQCVNLGEINYVRFCNTTCASITSNSIKIICINCLLVIFFNTLWYITFYLIVDLLLLECNGFVYK